jgi:3-methylcrotonyl-CoA carboxylase alpha subunit
MNRILIANRGEIACRIHRTCKRLGLETVAIYSDADAGALHAAMADTAIAVGAAPAMHSYLSAEKILAAARQSGAVAIHPGYGFLSENEDFARAVEAAGMTWIGPEPKTIQDMGDKERARLLARAAGIPILPGSSRIAAGSKGGLERAARDVGFPLLVKAAAGGGGIGMRRVDTMRDLGAAVEATQAMAARAFGDGTVYLERCVAQARHVEVQVFGFGDGRAMHLFERDCSTQRRYQKIVEESPAPRLPQEVCERMYRAAAALCAQERYRGAGTVEFVVDADSGEFYFLEMNTRIQVEHGVTEMITGLDLVEMQIRLAAGQTPLVSSQADVRRSGHAIECRVYAERPAKNFLPAPGVLSRFDVPCEDPRVRIDSGVRAGDRITHFYDPMIAKVIVCDVDRDSALKRMQETLSAIVVEGVETNLDFLGDVLNHPEFRAGEARTNLVQRITQQMLPTAQ